MDISITLPTDNGFLRRECPQCQRQFKWHHGPTEDRPDDAVDPAVYWCPYCGQTAPPTDWWTEEQLEFARTSMAGPATQYVADQLLSSFGQGSNGLLSISVTGDQPEPPPALHEAPDMVLVQSPCHPWEPIKISEAWSDPIHCLVCGQPFAID